MKKGTMEKEWLETIRAAIQQERSEGILEQLYAGEIRPAEEILPDDPEYLSAQNRLQALQEDLKSALPKEGRNSLERYFDQSEELHLRKASIECYAGFNYGLKLGARLVWALFLAEEEKSA